MRRFLVGFSVLLASSVLALGLLASPAKANEGIIEMTQTVNNGENMRCWASSILLTNFRYNLQVTCRNLVYPSNTGKYAYTLWAVPVTPIKGFLTPTGVSYVRLGELGFGPTVFTATVPFTSLFVTQEAAPGAKAPSSSVVMRGTLKTITFLESKSTPTPVPTNGAVATPVPSPTASAKPTSGVAGKVAIAVVIILFIATIITVIAILVARSRFK